MVFFETPAGGAVFSVGAIGWAGALPCDRYENAAARITKNVLERFLSAEPFNMPEETDQTGTGQTP
jgi:N,N-dimethylformamidase